jgi:hypothetical protein
VGTHTAPRDQSDVGCPILLKDNHMQRVKTIAHVVGVFSGPRMFCFEQ